MFVGKDQPNLSCLKMSFSVAMEKCASQALTYVMGRSIVLIILMKLIVKNKEKAVIFTAVTASVAFLKSFSVMERRIVKMVQMRRDVVCFNVCQF